MLQVGLSWQEAYKVAKPDIIVAMNGEGSGIGLKALINGEIDLAHSSRPIKKSEIEQIKEKYGKEPNEIIFGYDRIAVYVHKDNPLNEISMAQLKGIFAEGGAIDDWSAIDPNMSGKVDRCSRSNTSGTYAFFKDAVCGKGADGKGIEFRGGATTMTGSAAVVDYVKTHKDSIGFSGMGYKTDDVKWLEIVKDGAGSDPTGDNYPIARSLYGFTVGPPEGAVQEYIDWESVRDSDYYGKIFLGAVVATVGLAIGSRLGLKKKTGYLGWGAALLVISSFFFILSGEVDLKAFFFTNNWIPTPADGNEAKFGALAMIYGTFATTPRTSAKMRSFRKWPWTSGTAASAPKSSSGAKPAPSLVTGWRQSAFTPRRLR